MKQHVLRFGVVGIGVAVVAAAIYVLAVQLLAFAPLIANIGSYLASVVLGFRLHAHWTFGNRGAPATNRSAARYVLGSLVALVLNSLWVVLLTSVLDAPVWLPVVPMVLVTPLITFMINRLWVFPAAA